MNGLPRIQWKQSSSRVRDSAKEELIETILACEEFKMRSYLEELELKRTEKRSKALAGKSKIEEHKGDSNEEDEGNA